MKKLIVLLLVLAVSLGLLAGCDMKNGRVQNSPQVTGTPRPAVTPDVTPVPPVSEQPSVSGTPGPRPDDETPAPSPGTSPEPAPGTSPEPTPGETGKPGASAASWSGWDSTFGYTRTTRAAACQAAAAAVSGDFSPLTKWLCSLQRDLAPETAGCSLRAAALAAELLDWEADCAPDLAGAAASARLFSSSLDREARRELLRRLQTVRAIALVLRAPGGEGLLKDCGSPADIRDLGEGEALFAVLLAAAGMQEAAPPAAQALASEAAVCYNTGKLRPGAA